MTIVKISETYDFSTQRDKMGLIGIHTPPRALVERHFGPMMNNYRFAKFLRCDVTLIPSATLPLDPNGVGLGGGKVYPSDSVNPLLYKAVSNSHFETIISRIYGGYPLAPSSDGSSISVVQGLTPAVDPPVGMDDFKIYYGILSQSKGWKKAFWNTGFQMSNLKPLMYQVIANYGNEITGTSSDMRFRPVISSTENSGWNGGGMTPSTNIADASGASVMRGKAQLAPALPLWGGIARNALITTLIEPTPCVFPTIYVGAIIIPPSHLSGSQMYYRMRITWTIQFTGLVSYQEHSSFLTYAANGAATQWADYEISSKDALDKQDDTADVIGLDMEKVMESGGA